MSGEPPLHARGEIEARRADETLLIRRLRELGVRRPIHVHENRTVMVSLDRSGCLRLHRGYVYGSDKTLGAVIRFVNAANRAERLAAEREIMAFPIDSYVRGRQRRRRRPPNRRDRGLLAELEELHARLNADFFDGALSRVPFRISDRMSMRLGEVTVDQRSHRVVEITVSRLHWERDGIEEVEKTLKHEMVHQWQAETGMKVDHGRSFRKKAREIGVAPAARRSVTADVPQNVVPKKV